MNLRGIRFNWAFDQSGVRNFHGAGWPYHKYLRPIGLTFNGSTFVAKTTTLNPRRGQQYGEPGNMELVRGGLMPKDVMPDCIRVWFRKGLALNAVGLAGPGLKSLLEIGYWYALEQPFMISLMTVAATPQERLAELKETVYMMRPYLPFRARFGIQLNITCPNAAHKPQTAQQVIWETQASLAILRQLGDDIALVPKIHALFDIPMTAQIAADPNCDALCNSNTIAWADIPEAERLRMFGTLESPLAKYGGGGISGKYLLPKVAYWVQEARRAGINKPIIAGGGILHPRDVTLLAKVGASAIAVGSAAFLRPWRVQRIINRANFIGRNGGLRW